MDGSFTEFSWMVSYEVGPLVVVQWSPPEWVSGIESIQRTRWSSLQVALHYTLTEHHPKSHPREPLLEDI
jgi:hypothetical protein